MNVFETHRQIINDYATYIRSFLNIADPQIREVVEGELAKGKLWPEPLLQFNPAFELVGTIAEVCKTEALHPDLTNVFRGYSLYRHQVEAISLGKSGQDFIVTSGTGSGKSLTYMGTIFHALLSKPGEGGASAVIVYPMNALINSQVEEMNRYRQNYEDSTGKKFPITFGRFTGQEKEDERQRMREEPPQILLTNYMMLELLLTRLRERPIRDSIYEQLQFLVFDELHTYRGRQGADVGMLIRRIRSRCRNNVLCIGTSATMVSVGSRESQREQVAKVATTLFGKTFLPEQVIQETLSRSVAATDEMPSKEDLAKAIEGGIDSQAGLEQLEGHPVAAWLENRVALEQHEGVLVRGRPQRLSEIATALAVDSGFTENQCSSYLVSLLQWISSVNTVLQDSGKRYTVLPFKLHQFISQTGSVYTTLDQGENRFITLEPGVYKQDESEKKPIFPNVFSRATGHAFMCVSQVGSKFEPREFRENADEEQDATDGYLVIGDDIWDPSEDLEYLPTSWVRMGKQGLAPASAKRDSFPTRINFDEYGNYSTSDPLKWSGWFMKAPLLFDPTGGVFFDSKTSEGTKLTQLGSEGRSTSTTITAFAILNRLNDSGFLPEHQKLLSFTDNRQDAALQAGHFNDFVQVVRLRAGIRKALANAKENHLTYATLGAAVANALDLPFLDFANRGEEPALANVKRRYEECFQTFLLYRALADLRRSWRIILPNLEQCGLLEVDYLDLKEVSEATEFWADLPLLNILDSAEREEFLSIILDFFRLEFAIHSENFLVQSKLKEYEKQFREMLRPPWTLDKNEQLREPFVLRYEPLHRSARIYSKSMGPASSLGRFIKLFAQQKKIDIDLRGEAYRTFILELMSKLEDSDYLRSQTVRDQNNNEISAFRLKIEKIIWKLGDGEKVKADVIKRRSYKDQQPRPNVFFRDVYQRDVSKTRRMRGDDHTGQLGTATRIEREDLFREGKINSLFCSPTMELGIDIGGLSVVHLRNAPPNAANYAQRSGRAGRSGQGALVFTYCSSYSPHDRHYFQQQTELVAGAVQAPRLDLVNRELLLTHLNALAVSEIGLPGLEEQGGAAPSLTRLVEDDGDTLRLSAETHAGLRIPPGLFDDVKANFKLVIGDFTEKLELQGSTWYSDEWVEQNLSSLADNLDASLERWRSLYRSARAILTRATQKIESGVLGAGSDEYKKFKRHQDQATRQLDLLRNEHSARRTELSEFYPYRYLASEGFLPGYNFTRLPLRIFLPTSDASGEFISRPRPIALREFGPLNRIYYNGRKYEVTQMVVQDPESSLTNAKISKKAGYFLTEDQKDLEICPFTGLNLGDNANTEHLHHLIEMTESRGEEKDRISCEEEERLSRGFDVNTYFSIDGGDISRVRKAVVNSSEGTLLNLRFVPAARLIHVNKQWKSRRDEGFPMGVISGDWRSSLPTADDNPREDFSLVKLWTSNLADALHIEPMQPLGLDADGVITLQHALKRAIESIFQIESNEMGVVAVGDDDAPNILLYEAAEGSLGVLSQFVEDVETFNKIVEKATEICCFDDPEYKGPASYNDLLSYYNQRDHRRIDRFYIQDALRKLAICKVEIQSNNSFSDYEEHYKAMRRALDPNSSTEVEFLDYLYQHGLRLPDSAQKRLDGLYVQPDFYYEPRIWIFCDGTPHDNPKTKTEDEMKRQAIIARGDEVWVYYYRENLAERVASRPDIFRKVR